MILRDTPQIKKETWNMMDFAGPWRWPWPWPFACCVSKFVKDALQLGFQKNPTHKQGTNIGVGKSLIFVTITVRKAVGAAFSSVSVLNASFRHVPSVPGIPLGSTAESSGVDLLKVTLEPKNPLRFSSRWRFTIYYILYRIPMLCVYYVYTHFFFRCWSNGMKTCCFTCLHFRLRPSGWFCFKVSV